MIRIIALTCAGHNLAKKLQEKMVEQLGSDCEIWFKPKPFTEQVQTAFIQGDRLILICATGIAMRTLAPVLQNKKVDPAVLVLDEMGEFVIPLLSGHEGGANDWAAQISQVLGSTLVQTTAKSYLNPLYAVGMGCERNCPIEYLEGLFDECLAMANITIDQVASINSIDIKDDEVGLIALAKKLNKPYHTWDKSSLSEVEDMLSVKSDYVYKIVGVYGVAESAALVAVKEAVKRNKVGHSNANSINSDPDDSELVLTKQKNTKATCAIARVYLETKTVP